jgi:hypothetical protein
MAAASWFDVGWSAKQPSCVEALASDHLFVVEWENLYDIATIVFLEEIKPYFFVLFVTLILIT